MGRQCCDCRDGEHDNYDEDVRLVVVRDPDTGRILKRAYLCGDHRAMYRADGYVVSTRRP
jgi:hypothetical protein